MEGGARVLVVVVNVTVRPEALHEFQEAILQNATRSVEREPGCVRFEVNQREDAPSEWLFYEVYEDGAAFEHHRQQPHFVAYQAIADKALSTKTLTRFVSRASGARAVER
jgi:quinol monooxygenase YgiN